MAKAKTDRVVDGAMVRVALRHMLVIRGDRHEACVRCVSALAVAGCYKQGLSARGICAVTDLSRRRVQRALQTLQSWRKVSRRVVEHGYPTGRQVTYRLNALLASVVCA